MIFQKIISKIFGSHRYCKCGWCKRHPICLDCYYDKVCNQYHENLNEGLRCQDNTYDLLQLRGVIEEIRNE